MESIICGNALDLLTGMDEQSVHCVITSPPYWGLRDYGCPEVVFGGDEGCEHQWGPERVVKRGHPGDKSTLVGTQTAQISKAAGGQGCWCSLCGAWRGQFGLEPTPEMYVEHTLEFLRAIWRVLRDDGTVWWNLGDSYSAASTHKGGNKIGPLDSKASLKGFKGATTQFSDGLAGKQLVMMLFRVALAAQADGWWVRSVIIWSKPNPMPESVRDRPTTAHEYVLLLTKSGTKQYWSHRDLNGVRVKPKADWRWRNRLTEVEVDYPPDDWKEKVVCPDCQGTGVLIYEQWGVSWEEKCERCAGKGKVQLWVRFNLWQGHDYFYDADAIREPHKTASLERVKHGLDCDRQRDYPGNPQTLKMGDGQQMCHPSGRNKRTVWEIATQPYKGQHYATFPPKLVEPMILAGTSPKVCAECGAPWERVTELVERHIGGGSPGVPKKHRGTFGDRQGTSQSDRPGLTQSVYSTIGFRPTCSCDAGWTKATVLDPCCGTGTTLERAEYLGRDYIGIDIDPKSIKMTEGRLKLGPIEYETHEGTEWVQPHLISAICMNPSSSV